MRHTNWWAAALTVALTTAAAVGSRVALDRLSSPPSSSLFPFLLPVVIAFAVAGVRAGVAATLLNVAAVVAFFIGPGRGFDLRLFADRVRLALFVGVCACVGFVCESLARARRRAERDAARLAEAEARTRELIDAVPHMVWVLGGDGKYRFVNRRWAEETGMTLGELNATGPDGLIHPDDWPDVLTARAKSLHGDEAGGVEFRHAHRGGGHRWVMARAVPLVATAEWVGTMTDIHDRKEAERQLLELNATLERRVAQRTAQLAESEERFRVLAGEAPVGIFMTDPIGACVFVNRRWCELAGMTAEQAAGAGWADALHPDDRSRVFAQWHDAVGADREFVCDYRIRRPDGTLIAVTGRATALRNPAGWVTGYIGTVTERPGATAGGQTTDPGSA